MGYTFWMQADWNRPQGRTNTARRKQELFWDPSFRTSRAVRRSSVHFTVCGGNVYNIHVIINHSSWPSVREIRGFLRPARAVRVVHVEFRSRFLGEGTQLSLTDGKLSSYAQIRYDENGCFAWALRFQEKDLHRGFPRL